MKNTVVTDDLLNTVLELDKLRTQGEWEIWLKHNEVYAGAKEITTGYVDGGSLVLYNDPSDYWFDNDDNADELADIQATLDLKAACFAVNNMGLLAYEIIKLRNWILDNCPNVD